MTQNAEEIVEIMKNCLQLNPFMRMTAYECLTKSRVFDDVRIRQKESFLKKLYEISLQDYKEKAIKI